MKHLIINYWQDCTRDNPINIVVARVLLGLYGIYVVLLSKDFALLSELGSAYWATDLGIFLPFYANLIVLPWIQYSTVLLLLVFCLGIAVRWTGLFAAIGLTWIIMISSSSPQPNPQFGFGATLILLYAILYKDEMHLDQIGSKFDHSFLKYALLLLGLGYAFDAYGKLLYTGFSWILDPSNMRIYIHGNIIRREHEPPFSCLIINHDWITIKSTILTILFELGLLFSIFTKRIPLILPIAGLAGMHIMIILFMNIWYAVYFVPIYFLFIPWDRLFRFFMNRDQP